MKRFGTFVIFLVLAWLWMSCGSAHDLRRAAKMEERKQEYIRSAIRKGATVRTDSTMRKIKFKLPGIKVEFTPKIITDKSEPLIFIKDSVITKIVFRPGINGRDTVYVETDCPDQEAEKDVAVGINQDIDARQNWTTLEIIGLLAGSLILIVLAFLFGYFFKTIKGFFTLR